MRANFANELRETGEFLGELLTENLGKLLANYWAPCAFGG